MASDVISENIYSLVMDTSALVLVVLNQIKSNNLYLMSVYHLALKR